MLPIQDLKIIIGLGNPGEKYKETYHNIGYIFISWLIYPARGGVNWYPARGGVNWDIKHKLFLASKFNDYVMIIKPLIFMNESGRAVKQALKYFKNSPEQALIIHDDSDIELGKYKLCFNKGSAGHLGVQSIIDSLGTKKINRLRIGIRRPAKTRKKAEKIVLRKIGLADKKILYSLFENLFSGLNFERNIKSDPTLSSRHNTG